MISDVEAAHILIAMSHSKPRVAVKATEKENTLPDRVPRQKRSSSRVPRKMRRNFPMDPSSSSSTALVAYVSQVDDPNGHIHHSPSMASPRNPPLSRKTRPMASSSIALVEYVSQEDASPPTMPPLSRKERPPPFPPKAKQPKKKEKVAASSWTSETTPEWLLKLMKGAEEPKKIIEKELSATDVSHSHNRLSMPCSNIIDLEFLTLTEQRLIEEDEGKKHKTGVNAILVVKFVDSDVLKDFDVNFRRWKMPKKSGSPTFVYNLVTGWNKVVDGCGLDENDKIRVWSFHSDGKLCFALALALATPSPPSPPLLLLPPPPSDSGISEPEEISSALVIYDKSNDACNPRNKVLFSGAFLWFFLRS
ncbi:hypothetical protein Bca101_059866 [Brassica carinata]